MPDLLAAGGMPLGLGVQSGGPLGPMSPSMAARALDKPAPALPPEGDHSSSALSRKRALLAACSRVS